MKKNIYVVGKIPEGKNSLKSRAAFVQRLHYDYRFEQLKDSLNVDVIDLRTDYANYMKFDTDGNLINLSETRLKNIDKDLYAVDFVADAFLELKKLCENSNSISDDNLKLLKPKKSWESLHQKYHKHINIIFDNYMIYLTKFNKLKNIFNFEDFVVNFIKYLDLIAFKTPILKSSYYLSRDYTASDTGFIIEIDSGKKDADKDKFNKYFNNYSYGQFVGLCKKTGFAIDKNCPWRLIFKMDSPEAIKYLNKYNINQVTFFKDYFYNTLEFDLDNLKNYMVILYNTFVEKEPTARNPKITTYNDIKFVSSNLFDRSIVNLDDVKIKYDDLYWFNIYCHISFVENKVKLTNEQYKATLKNLMQDFKIKGKMYAFKQLKFFISKCDKVEGKDAYNFSLLDAT